MPVTAQHVRETLAAYVEEHPLDKDSLAVLTEVLEAAGDSIASRKDFRGHVTAGAVLLRPDGRLLTIRHKALKKWLFPGGHLEASDTTLMGAALRELAEETGISPDQVAPAGVVPLHIDTHPIPDNPAKGEPDHQHFDFRFLFRTTADVTELQAEEVTGSSWLSADAVTPGALRSRLMTLRP
ncbi:NUDIX hydrolase [Streptomyces polygonati]|uniref:NUDIX hydrolase n=1 Tax=Streptomyces polygonati TaxID=1617087 RepID=A0ABV8HX83_9ACTN